MSEPNRLSLEVFPEAAALLREERIADANTIARHYLPQLEPGAPIPPFLPQVTGEQAGTFFAGMTTYSFRITPTAQGQLLLFRPAPQTAITDGQLDGALRQLRQFMGEFLSEVEGESPAFRKSYYRMFRLMDNLEFLAAARAEKVPHPTPLDLVGLCRQLVLEAAPLLAETEVELCYQEDCPSLLIPGDPALLRRLVLELVANAARAVGTGTITLQLRHRQGRALLTLTHSGGAASPRQLAAMLQQDTSDGLPMPGAGAGLGMAVVRRIVDLHDGTLLMEWGQDAPCVVLSLPTGPLSPRLPVESPRPRIQTDGGLHPTLVALADVLPARVFEDVELD